MSTIKLKIAPAVAAFVAPGVSRDLKLQGMAAAETMTSCNRVTLLFCLTRDSDRDVKEAARAVFAVQPAAVLIEYIVSTNTHPAILDSIAQLHYENRQVVKALLASQELSPSARLFLEQRELEMEQAVDDESFDRAAVEEVEAVEDSGEELNEEGFPPDDELSEGEPEEEYLQQTEEFLSKYQMAQMMGIGEKIKMALTGDKEWRAILIKDANKLVSGSVIKNPRITDGEVLTILKVGVQNDEIIRLICANKEWVKNYKIRKALVDCHKTPLPNALRYLASLGEKDIAGYAKSKNISSVLSTQAKRILLAKKR